MSKLTEPEADVQDASTGDRARRGRPEVRAQRRREIVDAATEVILQFGIEGATRSRIADAAGMQPSAVHYFVGTQDDVLTAAITAIGERVQRALGPAAAIGGDASDTPRDAIDQLFGTVIDRPDINQLVDELVAHSYRDERSRRALADLYEGFTDHLASLLRDAWPAATPERLIRRRAAELLGLVHAAGTFRHLGRRELADAAHARGVELVTTGPG